MAQLINVKLSRFDSSPWGFRLQGGKDFGAPLLIQKVNGGSLAEKAGLQAGDAVIKVNDVEVFNLRHKEAQDAIVRAGNSFAVTVQRGGSTWKPQVTPVGPTPTINSSPTANIQPVTKTSLAAKQPAAKPIGTGHNLAAKPFGAPQVNGEPTVKSIVNKQYNTPVGMYSEESIAETLSAQAEVLAGGVLGVNFMKNEKNYNAANSEVFKMVQEIDSEPRESEPAVLSRSPESSEPPVGAAPVVSPPVTGLRHVSAPETRPTPTTPHEDPFKILPPGQNICADCERLIVGVFVRIKDKNLHVECFKCATCGTSLKNVGYYNINNKLYCDVHAKLVARQHPPAPNLEPITIPPGGKAPAGTISAALSSVTAPGPRPVPGPTSAPAPSLAPAPRSVPAPRSAPAPVSPSSPQTIGPMPFHPVGRPQISENGFVTENNLKNILTAIPALAIDDTDSGTVHPTVPSSIMSKQYKAPRIGTSHVNAPGSLQSPNIISAPKPFSVPTAPTTSPARPAPATSNKLVWPPHKEEEIPSSLLATAIPLYIPPTPSHQPKKSAIFAVPAQSSQTQFIGSQQNQTTPEHTQQQTASEKYLVKQDPVHLPSTQAKIQPLPSVPQPHSNAVSQVKETSLEEQQFSQQETETISLTSSSQENSTLKVQRDLIQEQQPESLVASGKETESVVEIIQSEGEIRTSSINSEGEVKSTTINSEGKVKTASVTSEGEVKTTSVTSESEVKTTSVNSEEVSLITQAEKTETSVEQIAELQTTVVQTSDSQEEQKPPSPPPPNDEILPQLTQETEKIQQTCEKIENVEVSAVEEVQIESLPIVEQSKVDTPISESSMMTEPAASDVSQSQVPSMSMEPIAAEVPSVSESEPQVIDSSLQTETKPIVQPEPQLSEILSLSNETATVQKQQASDPQLQSGNPGGSSINIQSQSTYTNKGLSYRQVPAGGFRPISSEFQTSVCQEVSQYTSVESFSKTTNTIQSSSNTGPISFPAQTPAHNPRNQSTPSDNPSRSEACSSPMISALTIAPDRPYCLVPSAMKPQAPTHVQSFIPSSQSEAPTHVQSFIPSSQFAGTKSHTVLSNQVPPSTNMPGLGDETQLPVLPPSSQHMSMVQALTIAPDRPYSPFLSSAQTPNTVVQSEASAFTAVSPQTVNTRPKMTVPQQSTVVSHIESGPQSYAVKPLPTSTVKRMAAKPASPRPVSRSSLPVMGAFRPTVPTGDLRPPNLDERWQLDSQQFETDTALSNTIQTRGMPNMTQVSLIDNTGGQVVVQRTRHVEESSTVSHREMQKTIQRSDHVSSVISSQELSNLSSTHSTLKETAVGSHQQLTNPVFTQQEKQQQQYQEAKHSSFGTHKPSAIPFYQQDIERFQIQRALSPAPHSPHIRAISPVTTQKPIFPASPSQVEKKDLPPQHHPQKQEVQTGSQSKPPTVPMVSQYRRQQYQQQQHEQKLYSLSDVQKPAVIPFYQQDIAGYQKQRAISPAPHSQQVQRAISPASQQKSTPIHYPPTAPMQQPVSQTPSKPATLPQQTPPVPAPAGPSEVQTFPQQQPLPSTQTVQNEPQQNTFTQTPAVPGSVPTLSQQQPLPPTPTIQNLPQQKNLTQTPAIPTQTPFSLPFPNIPLPEGMSVETLMMKNTQLSTKSSILASQPQPSQVFPPAPQASKSLPTAQPSPVTQSSTSAFKPQSPQKLPTEPQQTTPSLATQPSSVTKIPIPPTSSSIPNAGGGIGGGAGGGPTGQKGSASFAGSSAPRRGRGVLNQQAPGARIPLCGHCNNQIRGPFITALGRIWCPEHFICVNAQCRRQLQDIGFVEEKGDLYCEFCFEQYIAPTCSKCSKKVKGDCLNAIGKQFHPECFLCAYCGKLFGNNPFYLEDGLPYCETDWNELFTTKCFACGFPIEAGDRWVEALNNNYHSQCFNCTSCKKNLEGQNFYAKGGRPFCKAHAR